MTPGRAPCTSSNFSSRPPAACTMALKASLCALISSMTGASPGAGGRKAQPAGQTVGRLGGAAGAGAVVLKGGEGGGQGRLAREIAHLDGSMGSCSSPWATAGRIDMSLQQVELAQLPGKACQRRSSRAIC
jgi:hypothetical protein